jgi:O-antigen/teichoic acid export membrane protein
MNLIGAAVAEVYVAEFAQRARALDFMGMKTLFRTYTARLAQSGVIPILVLALAAPWLFGFALGQQWKEAGQLTRVLTPLFLADFVAFPLSRTLTLLERQGLQFAWDLMRFVAVVSVIVIGHALGWSSIVVVGAFGLVLATFYAVLAGLGYGAIRRGSARLLAQGPQVMNESLL